ncbi:hypothetical protein HYU50_01830 [Candidatus Woesearchaeota archaeon]|nr:hypothetical protein [Candidatus Woesearchaeota archaeon]
MEDEKVKQLAETLKKQGLAASMYEAMEKAKSILNVKSQIDEDRQKRTEDTPKAAPQNAYPKQEEDKDNELLVPDYGATKDYDITRETASLNELMLNELLKEVGVTPEQVEQQEKQKTGQIKEK